MGYISRPERLEPETLADIKARHAEGDPGNGCDCDMARHWWSICDYHKGYDDGIDQQRRKARQIEQDATLAEFHEISERTDPSAVDIQFRKNVAHLRQGSTEALTEFWAVLDAGTPERNAKDQT